MNGELVIDLDRHNPTIRGERAGHEVTWVNHKWSCTCGTKRGSRSPYYPHCRHINAIAQRLGVAAAEHLINARRRAGLGPAGPAKNSRA